MAPRKPERRKKPAPQVQLPGAHPFDQVPLERSLGAIATSLAGIERALLGLLKCQGAQLELALKQHAISEERYAQTSAKTAQIQETAQRQMTAILERLAATPPSAQVTPRPAAPAVRADGRTGLVVGTQLLDGSAG